MKTIDKQHVNVGKSQNERYKHIFSHRDHTFKVYVKVDKSYPKQGEATISVWYNCEWRSIHRLFGMTCHEKFKYNPSKIEDYLLKCAEKVLY